MNAAPLVSMNGSAPFTRSWLQQSVQEFFSGINWEDKPIEIYELSQGLAAGTLYHTPDVALSLSLTVSQFMAAIPWDGATIGALPTTTAPVDDDFDQDSPDSLTLEGFSDLFG